MADRTVKVRLSAQVAEYASKMKEAADATRTVGTEAEKVTQYKQAFNAVGTAGVVMAGVIGTALAVAVKKFADFDQAMSAVGAATHESAANMDLLKQAALDAGASTVFSATEAAHAIEELAKAGVATSDILGGGLAGALDLAAAGNLGVADAAGIAATALKMFNLEGDDMSHVADLLAAGAGKAMGDVSDLSQALNQAGLVANQTGLSIEETTAGLAAFAEQGLIGSDAGTSFKSMLQRLTPQSAEAERMMTELGISAYDASGEFVGLASFASNLQGALKDLTPEQRNAAMATMFGSDAVRAAGVIYAQGEDGIRDWISAVDDQGYAAQTAARRLDNLKGDLEELGGAMETALITTGSAANDTLRTMAQALTGLVDMYNDLPQPVQDAVTAVGGATAAVGLAGGAAFLAVPKFIDFKNTIEGVGWSMGRMSLTTAGAGLALGGLFLIIGELAAEHQRAQQRASAYSDTLEKGTNRITKATRDMAKENLAAKGEYFWWESPSAYDAAENLGISLDLVTDAATGNVTALRELDVQLKALKPEGLEINTRAGKNALEAYEAQVRTVTDAVKGESSSIEQATAVAEQKQRVDKQSAGTSGAVTEAYIAEADAAGALRNDLQRLIDIINEANGVGRDAITANIDYRNALAEVDEQIQKAREGEEGYALTLDQSTRAGRDNMEMLVGLAADSQSAAQAQLELDNSAEGYIERMREGRQALIDSAIAMGATQEEAELLADKIHEIPTEAEITAIMHTAAAQAAIDNFVNKNGNKTVNVWLNPQVQAANDAFAKYLNAPGRATGGPIHGPGTGTSDEAGLYRLSNGEHVVTAAEVRGAGGHSEVEKWRSMMLAGEEVTPAYATPYASGVFTSPKSSHSPHRGLMRKTFKSKEDKA